MTEKEAWNRAAEWFDAAPTPRFLEDARALEVPPDLLLYLAPAFAVADASVRSSEALQAYASSLVSETRQREAALEVTSRLSREEVPHAFLKGCDFRYRVYADPASRALNDLDVWVAPAEREKALRTLEAVASTRADEGDRRAFLSGRWHECGFKIGEVAIDVHTGITQPGRDVVSAEEWLGRAAPHPVPGGRLPVLDPIDSVAIALVHIGRHEGLPEYVHFKHGLDLACAARRWPDLDWDAISRRTTAGRCRRLAGAALWSFASLLRGRIPEAAWAALDPGPWARTLASTTRARWPVERSRPGRLGRMGQLLRKLAFAEGLRERGWIVREWVRRRGSLSPAVHAPR